MFNFRYGNVTIKSRQKGQGLTSSVVLLLLVSSLSLAVLLPEYQSNRELSSQPDSYTNLIKRQRRAYAILGSFVVVTFAMAIELLSVSLFITHLVLDCIFGIYALNAFRYRREVSIRNYNHVSISNESIENSSDYVQIHDRDESLLREAV